jgi:hypothetical protein
VLALSAIAARNAAMPSLLVCLHLSFVVAPTCCSPSDVACCSLLDCAGSTVSVKATRAAVAAATGWCLSGAADKAAIKEACTEYVLQKQQQQQQPEQEQPLKHDAGMAAANSGAVTDQQVEKAVLQVLQDSGEVALSNHAASHCWQSPAKQCSWHQ